MRAFRRRRGTLEMAGKAIISAFILMLSGAFFLGLARYFHKFALDLPRAGAGRIERELIESGDPALRAAAAGLRSIQPTPREALILWRSPDSAWEIFSFYRFSYELFPTRIWFLPLEEPPRGRGALRIPAQARILAGSPIESAGLYEFQSIPIGTLSSQSLQYAVAGARGDPKGTAIYRIATESNRDLSLTYVNPPPDPATRRGAERTWLWPIGLASLFFLGLVFARLTGMNRLVAGDSPVFLAVCLISGAGVVSLFTAILSVAGIPLRMPAILALLLASAALYPLGRGDPRSKRGQESHDVTPPIYSGMAAVGTGLIILALTAAAIRTFIPEPPFGTWDSWVLWDLKARACFEEGGIPFNYLRDSRYQYSCRAYPLGWPILQAYLANWTYGIEPAMLRLLSPVLLLCLLFLFSSLLLELGVGRIRWFYAGLLAHLPMLLTRAPYGQADVPIAAAMTGCLLMALKAARGAAPLWTVAWMGAITASIKDEGLIWGVGCIITAWFSCPRGKNRMRNGIIAALVFGSLVLPWKIETRRIGIKPSDRKLELSDIMSNSGRRIGMYMKALALETLGPGATLPNLTGEKPLSPRAFLGHPARHWMFLWHFVFFALALNLAQLRAPPRARIAFVIALQLTAIGAAYAISVHEIAFHINTSLDRLLMQIIPAALALAISVFPQRLWSKLA